MNFRGCSGAGRRPGAAARAGAFLLLLVAASWCVSPAAVAGGPAAHLLTNAPDRIVFDYQAPAWRLTPVQIEGRSYQRIEGSNLSPSGQPGWPEIPVDGVSVGIPFDRVPRVSVQVLESSEVPDVLLPPVATERIRHGADRFSTDKFPYPVMEYHKDAEAYADAMPYPLENARLLGTHDLRHQHVAQILVAPFQYRASEHRLFVATRMRITVDLAPAGRSRLTPARPERAAWEGVYDASLLNAKEARGWRMERETVAAPLGLRSAPGAGGVAVRRARPLSAGAANDLEYKLQVMQSGFYRIPFESLTGFPSGIPTSQVKIFQRQYVGGATPVVENLLPIRVVGDTDNIFGPGDSLLFRGLSFHDQYVTSADWEDAWGDTNVYWVSYDAAGGSPAMIQENAWPGLTLPATPDSFTTDLYAEQDLICFDYPARREMDVYYWVAPGTRVPVDFPGIISSLPVSFSFRDLLMGQNSPDGSVDSVTTFLARPGGLPDLVLGTFMHSYSGVPYDFPTSVTDGTLAGANHYFIYLKSTLPYYETLLDWYKARYTRRYQLESYENQLLFHNQQTTGNVQYLVRDFPERNVDLYRLDNLGNPVFEVGDSIAQGANGYDLRFQHVETDSTAWQAIAHSGYLAPASIARLQGLPDLVNDPLTPDYLMIAWDSFLPSLDPLVAYRQGQGYKVRAAAVSRVYDLFGNGMRSPYAIKNYISHAYEAWNAGYALLVGDGSRDERGVDNNRPDGDFNKSYPNYIPTWYLHDPFPEEDLYTLRAHDNWYADLAGDDWIPEIALGRFPAESNAAVSTMVTKTIAYESPQPGDDWRRKMFFFADDEYVWPSDPNADLDCWGGGQDDFLRWTKIMEDSVRASAAQRAEVVPFHLADWLYAQDDPAHRPGGSAPGCNPPTDACCTTRTGAWAYTRANVTPALLDSLSQGVFIWNYQGHANRNVLTHEYCYIETPDFWQVHGHDAQTLTNSPRPFLCLAYACYVSMFDMKHEPYDGQGVGETMLQAPAGGAVALYASPGLELLAENTQLNWFLTNSMWSGSQPPSAEGLVLGPAIASGVVAFAGHGYSDARFRSYHLLGDPALRLDMGAPLPVVTVNDSVVADGAYLAKYVEGGAAHIAAEFRDEGGIPTTEVVNTRIGQTPLVPGVDYTVRALADSGASNPRRLLLSYDTQVSLQDFEVRFQAADVNGHSTTFTLKSGLSVSFLADEAALSQGETIAPHAVFRAHVDSPLPIFGDSLGIRLDGVPRTDVVRAPVGSDSVGYAYHWDLTLPAMDLTVGNHTLAVTLAPNSVTPPVASVTFEVRGDVEVSYAFGYPNPFRSQTVLCYELRPAADRVDVDIYTVSGRRIRALADGTGTAGANQLTWDGRDDQGDVVASGVYLFRLRAHSETGAVTERIGRLVKIAR